MFKYKNKTRLASVKKVSQDMRNLLQIVNKRCQNVLRMWFILKSKIRLLIIEATFCFCIVDSHLKNKSTFGSKFELKRFKISSVGD